MNNNSNEIELICSCGKKHTIKTQNVETKEDRLLELLQLDGTWKESISNWESGWDNLNEILGYSDFRKSSVCIFRKKPQ